MVLFILKYFVTGQRHPDISTRPGSGINDSRI